MCPPMYMLMSRHLSTINRYDVDLSVQLADSTSTATSARLPAAPLYIDNHLSSAAGGAAPPLCIDNHISSAAGGAAPPLCIDNRLSSAASRAAPPLIIDSISAWPPA